jgi:hypothetical protein
MKILKKPLDYVVKQLQSKRFHVKKQENRKAYDRMKTRKEARKLLDDSSSRYMGSSLVFLYNRAKLFSLKFGLEIEVCSVSLELCKGVLWKHCQEERGFRCG